MSVIRENVSIVIKGSVWTFWARGKVHVNICLKRNWLKPRVGKSRELEINYPLFSQERILSLWPKKYCQYGQSRVFLRDKVKALIGVVVFPWETPLANFLFGPSGVSQLVSLGNLGLVLVFFSPIWHEYWKVTLLLLWTGLQGAYMSFFVCLQNVLEVYKERRTEHKGNKWEIGL